MSQNGPATETMTPSRSVRVIALLEWTKGGLAAAATSTLLAIGARGASDVLASLARLAPYDAIHRGIAALIRHIDGASIRLVAAFLAVYAVLRCVEGWGLWRGRAWASWLGVVSVALYLPFDLYASIRDPGLAYGALVALNLAILWILAHDLAARRRKAGQS